MLRFHPLPQGEIVWLEDRPLGSPADRLLDVVEEPSDVDVSPAGVGQRQRPGTPHPDPVAAEAADAVDADRVELSLLAVGDGRLQPGDAAQLGVGRRLVHPTLGVGAGPTRPRDGPTAAR